MGLHFWLPLAHSAAPGPASAVLSGAMIMAALLGWLRFLPLGDTALPATGLMLVVMGLGAAFFGAVAGVTQKNPKTVLAYSSISQMGIITVGVGAGLALKKHGLRMEQKLRGWSVAGFAALLLFALGFCLLAGGRR